MEISWNFVSPKKWEPWWQIADRTDNSLDNKLLTFPLFGDLKRCLALV